MNRLAALILPLGLAGAALAQAALPMIEDTDGNGTWSLAELQAVWPDLTDEGFAAVDTNADGAADPVETQTAWDNGVLKPVEG